MLEPALAGHWLSTHVSFHPQGFHFVTGCRLPNLVGAFDFYAPTNDWFIGPVLLSLCRTYTIFSVATFLSSWPHSTFYPIWVEKFTKKKPILVNISVQEFSKQNKFPHFILLYLSAGRGDRTAELGPRLCPRRRPGRREESPQVRPAPLLRLGRHREGEGVAAADRGPTALPLICIT